MLKISFIELECLFTAVWLLCRIIVWISQRRINWKREAVLLLMYINLAVIIRFTFFPMSRVNGSVQPLIYDASTAFPFRVNLIPFVNLFDYDSRRDLLLNVIGNIIELGVKTNNCRIVYFIDLSYQRISKVSHK